MAMDPARLKAAMQQRIYNGLKENFGPAAGVGTNYTPVADEYWQKLAEAVSRSAMDIVMEITANADVTPGIPVVGIGGGSSGTGPITGATVAPGKVL